MALDDTPACRAARDTLQLSASTDRNLVSFVLLQIVRTVRLTIFPPELALGEAVKAARPRKQKGPRPPLGSGPTRNSSAFRWSCRAQRRRREASPKQRERQRSRPT